MYIIKILDETKKNKCYIGYSNSSFTDGYYFTSESRAGVFVKDINEMPKLKNWLESKKYSYDIIVITEKKHRRIYY